jgi:hypothetical protein
VPGRGEDVKQRVSIPGGEVRVRLNDAGRLFVWVEVDSADAPFMSRTGKPRISMGISDITVYATNEDGESPWHSVPEWGGYP